jgi:urocanate hydratase
VAEVDESRVKRRLETKYLDRLAPDLDSALVEVRRALEARTPLSVAVVMNAADLCGELVQRGITPDLLTDQTSAHDPLNGYVPSGFGLDHAASLRRSNPTEYVRIARETMAVHVRAMLELKKRGAHTFDYGNNIRGEARTGGVTDAFTIPGFVPAYIRPLFCRGKGPFRWVALSGDPDDIARTDEALLAEFPDDQVLQRWLPLAANRISFQGLPARICWLGYGERDRAGLLFNDLVRRGVVKAPIVIGRDHLDAGSVASPYRETEGMKDGTDAVADWPILNALVSTASGAAWVSFHHGGGVGIGNSLHAGLVVVADGTPEAAVRLKRVLTNDPAMGVFRHADAGYAEAIDCARETGLDIPSRDDEAP